LSLVDWSLEAFPNFQVADEIEPMLTIVIVSNCLYVQASRMFETSSGVSESPFLVKYVVFDGIC
jgi:hypothetical protein